MTLSILKDADTRPDLFHWFGAIDDGALLHWSKAHGLQLPRDLTELWLATGGGDFLESETILGPLADDTGDQAWALTEQERQRGLPGDAVIYHVGLGGFSAYRSAGSYTVFDVGHNEIAAFESFDQWYLRHVRTELGERYGLGPILFPVD